MNIDQALAIVMPLLIFFVLDGIILISSLRQGITTKSQGLYFHFILLVTISQGLTAITYACDEKLITLNHGLQFAFNFISLCCMAMAALIWFIYLYYTSPVFQQKGFKAILAALSVPVLVLLITGAVSPWTHWIMYIDENGVYRSGSLAVLQLVPYLYIVLAFALPVEQKIKGRSAADIIRKFPMFAIPSIIGAAVNMLVIRGGYVQIGCSIGALLMYMKQYIVEVNEVKRLKSVDEINNRLQEQLMLVNTLSQDYLNVFVILPSMNIARIIKLNGYVTEGMKRDQSEYPYDAISTRYIRDRVYAEDIEMMTEVMDLNNVQSRLAHADTYTGTYRVWNEGEIHFYQYNYAKIVGSDQIIAGFQNVDAVIAAERAQQEELRDAMHRAERANAAKSDFLARMSHDIRTPMNGILGLIDLSERHPDDLKLQQENREKAKKAANHLLSLINDVLELSKLEDSSVTLAHEPFDLLELTGDILSITAPNVREHGLRLSYGNCEQVFQYPYVFGSPLHVRQILLNILSNAVKYNRPGGSIDCTARLEAETDSTVTYSFRIADTGIGMTKEFQEHIFEPFSQEKHDARSTFQGTGLGMSIVKNLVDRMNGSITVESEVGKGSVFTVTLPFEIASEAQLPPKAAHEVADLSGIRVLLVEDNELNMEIALAILEDFGAQVSTAANGQEAVERFCGNPSGTYDVILMDLMMPVLDGFGATAAIRAFERPDAKTIPIIAMTANAFDEDKRKCLEAGMNAHIAKPIDVPRLVEILAGVRNEKK